MSINSIRSIILFMVANFAIYTTAQSEPNLLQIKGKSIGQNSMEACSGAPMDTSMDELLTGLIKDTPAMKLTNSSSCDVSIPTFAGQAVSGMGQLLFVNDKLIQLKFELSPMSWSRSVSFFNDMDQAYGKTQRPVLDKFSVFYSKTWKQKGQAMTLSWPDTKKSGIFSIEVTLSETQAMKEFWILNDYNKKQLDIAVAKDRVNDTK